MSFIRLLGAGALAVLVSSCAYVDVEDVRGLDPQGSDFAKALFAEYVTLADEEVAHGLLEQALVFGEFELHGLSSSRRASSPNAACRGCARR